MLKGNVNEDGDWFCNVNNSSFSRRPRDDMRGSNQFFNMDKVIDCLDDRRIGVRFYSQSPKILMSSFGRVQKPVGRS